MPARGADIVVGEAAFGVCLGKREFTAVKIDKGQ
jgi:hypothetical protein